MFKNNDKTILETINTEKLEQVTGGQLAGPSATEAAAIRPQAPVVKPNPAAGQNGFGTPKMGDGYVAPSWLKPVNPQIHLDPATQGRMGSFF